MTQADPNSAPPVDRVASRGRWMLATSVLVAAAVLAGGEMAARRYLVTFRESFEKPYVSSERVQFVTDDMVTAPPPPDLPELLVIGNSHTYGRPGRQRGDPVQLNGGQVLPHDLWLGLRDSHPDLRLDCVLLSYPNFLPYEMLIRTAQLLQSGHRPRVVVLGISFRNIERDSQLRDTVRDLLRDDELRDKLETWLGSDDGPDVKKIQTALRADSARVSSKIEAERTRSLADRWDARLTDWVRGKFELLGRGARLRGQILTDYVLPLQTLFFRENVETMSYDLIESDYQFNRQCLSALLRMLKQNGATVVCYYAPERPDTPRLTDTAQQATFCQDFEQEAAALGAVVLDARAVVPEECWGWTNLTRDRSHFQEEGHRLLARFIIEQMERHDLWSRLESK